MPLSVEVGMGSLAQRQATHGDCGYHPKTPAVPVKLVMLIKLNRLWSIITGIKIPRSVQLLHKEPTAKSLSNRLGNNYKL
jgi:hypothetical protein